jgi:hypothetical protein
MLVAWLNRGDSAWQPTAATILVQTAQTQRNCAAWSEPASYSVVM